MSIIFYAWGEPSFVFVLIVSIFINWIMGILISKFDKNQRARKTVLILDIVFNVGVLCVFKYTNFIVDTINYLIGRELIKVQTIALPIGISFFTFQIISYIVDLYRREVEVQKNILNLGLYIAFFPQLVAGPIVRYNSIADQIKNRKHTVDKFTDGVNRFLQGLIKKIVIANNMATIADKVFELTRGGSDVIKVPSMLAWVGVIAYTLQLYYDFSSYSDMAIGLGKMFGFVFEENFNYPFISKSAREFMSRWHISLQTWFTQYVYIPLGGSRVKNQDVFVRNMFIVWLLTGIWHGAAWTFIIWGMYYFIIIIIERLVMFDRWKCNWFKHIYTLLIVAISMVIFRAEDMWQLTEMLKNMFAVNGNGIFSSTAIMIVKEYGIVFAAGIICALPVKDFIQNLMKKKEVKVPKPARVIGGLCYVVGICALVFFCIIVLAKGGYNPFIYFNF
jgi:alginate O-acetyltransferase complex protein AlgI